MKKLTSMLLVLTMVISTLMGVMLVDVNAASTEDAATTIVVTPATGTTPRKIEYRYGLSLLPASGTKTNPVAESTSRYATGEWWAAGYKYSGVLDPENPVNLSATGKHDMVKFAEVSVVDNPLDTLGNGKMSKISFKNATIYDDTFTANKGQATLTNSAGATVSKITANYLRFMLIGEDLSASATTLNTSSTYSYATVENADMKEKFVTGEGGAYVYTLYAYTNKQTDQNAVNYQMTNKGSSTGTLELKSNYIYSEAGVPHKVQLVVSGKSLDAKNVYYHLYVDGVNVVKGATNSAKLSSVFNVMLRENITLAGTASYTVKECDWYVTNTGSGLMAPVFMEEEDLKKELISVPNMYSATRSTTYRTDNYVTGVNSTLATDIKAVLETTTAGDKYVEIAATRYRNPSSLFDGTDGSVKLVSRTTGKVVDPATAPGTMDNYYLKVNGIYIIPKAGEAPAGTLELLGVSYNPKENVAQLQYSEHNAPEDVSYTFQIVVGAYNAKSELIDIKVSTSTTISGAGEDGEHSSTFTPAFSQNTLNVASYYKVFALKSLTSAIPLVPAGYASNPYKENSFTEGQVTKLVTTFIGDAKTSRGFAWSAESKYTNMVVEYAPAGVDFNSNKKQAKGKYEVYNGILYYKADVTDLASGTEYIYRLGDTSYNTWSGKYSFTTEADNVTSFSFVGFTDPQSTTGADGFALYRTAVEGAMNDAPDAKFMVMLGDMINTGTNASQWTEYFKTIGGYAESIPHMGVVGNHELSGDEVTAGKYYTLQFNNPDNAGNWVGTLTADNLSAANNKGAIANYKDTVYSFDYGNAHFVVLNTGYHTPSADTKKIIAQQTAWLENDLKNSDAKWKIVMLHQGLYGAKSTTSSTREALEPIMDAYDVDLVLQGHDHFVMRTYPMTNGAIVTQENPNNITKGTGTVYTILGASGPKRYEDTYTAPWYAASFVRTSEELPTYTTFKVSDSKIEVVTKQIDGVVVDSFTITEVK